LVNIAEAFRKLESRSEDERWYNQLFLVSHDQSFQGITRHYIHLELNEEKETVVDSPIASTIKHVHVSTV